MLDVDSVELDAVVAGVTSLVVALADASRSLDGELVRPLIMNPAPVPMSRSNLSVAHAGHLRFTGADIACTISNVWPQALHR